MMNLFNRLPGSRREKAGLEWKIFKKLPAILLGGTLCALGLIAVLQSGLLGMQMKDAMQFQYAVVGWLLFHWMSILAIGLFCSIVIVMKGHAYVLDAYPLSDSEHPQA